MDIDYWNKFYNDINIKNELNIPSDFCNYILNYLKINNIIIKNVLDCGCGNGRDTYKLSEKYITDGVDNSGFIPEKKNNNLSFYNLNFVNMNKDKYDLIYSRFSLHSISNEEHIIFLNSIKINSYLTIEVRSNKNKLDNKYYNSKHYRNYIDKNYLENLLKEKFQIIYIEENINFAKYKNENPMCIRVIAKKISI